MPRSVLPLQNRLIELLPEKQRNRLLKQCTTVNFEFGAVLGEANEPHQYAYFPISGFISLVTSVEDHPPLEMGLIGNEGMLGTSLVLGINLAPMQSIVQGSGIALRLPVPQFEQELKRGPEMTVLLNRYIYTLMQQLTQATTCIHYHPIEKRLARWLLMTHDRAHKNTFHLTHFFLSHMLGVRRSGISLAASALRKKFLIDYTRGEITVLDRKGLEAESCRCYQTMTTTYEKIISG